MFQKYEEMGLFSGLEKNEFRNTISGVLFKYSSDPRRDIRTSVTITNDVNGIRIVMDGVNKYLYSHLESILKTILLDIRGEKYGNIKKMKGSAVVELRQSDPMLLGNLLHGQKYSRIVQKNKQPRVITEQEYKSKAIPEISKTKYINVTTGKPAYYSCDQNKFGNTAIYYITGKHADGWCLPGCKPPKKSREDSILDHKRSVCEKQLKFFEKVKRKKTQLYTPQSIEKLKEGVACVLRKDNMILKQQMFVHGCAQGLGILPSVLMALNMTLDQFVADFSRYSAQCGDIFKTTLHYLRNQNEATFEKSDMLDFINDNIMYFVLGCFGVSVSVIENNQICTYGILSKNIFVFTHETVDKQIEYYPVFIRKDKAIQFIIPYADTNADMLEMNPASAEFFERTKKRLRAAGFAKLTALCDTQFQCFALFGQSGVTSIFVPLNNFKVMVHDETIPKTNKMPDFQKLSIKSAQVREVLVDLGMVIEGVVMEGKEAIGFWC